MQKALNAGFWLAILLYFVFLLSLVSPSRHVDPDFFQFLRDSEYYLKLELPPFIQSLPMNPILIGVFSLLLGNFFTEIEIALLINAVSISGAIALFYYLTKKRIGIVSSGLGTVFLITNPIVFVSAVSNNTEVLFSFFLMLIAATVWKEKITLAVILSAMGILIRYESILLFVALFIVEIFKTRKFSSLFKKLLVFLAISLPILFVLINQNQGNSALKTPFLIEVMTRIEDIPEERFFTHFPFALFPYKNLVSSNQSVFLLSTGFGFWTMMLILVYKSLKNESSKLPTFSFSFTLLYLFFHVFFPAYLERYFVPAIFSFTFSVFLIAGEIKKISKIIFAILIIFLITVNSRKINSSRHEIIFDNADYFTAETIVKSTQKTTSYILLSPYPETIEYYYKDKNNIQLVSINNFKIKNECENLDCAFKKTSEKEIIVPYNSLFDWGMTGTYDHSLRKWYQSIGFYELGDFINSKNACLWHNEELPLKKTFVRLYKPCYK